MKGRLAMEDPGKVRHSRSAGSHPRWSVFLVATAALFLAAAVPSWAAEFDAAWVRIEINATDGDVGFHLLFDGGPWKEVEVRDSKGRDIFEAEVSGALGRKGGTEVFFEGAEPPCSEQSVAEFLKRFREGTYKFRGVALNGRVFRGEFHLSHDLPAAPNIAATDEHVFNAIPVMIQWAPGNDLGECHDEDVDALIADGAITVPATGDLWEVVVEPDVEDSVLEAAGLPLLKFSVQVPPGQQSVTVPSEYLQPYVAAGITTFKFEVGNKLGENQTFSEGTFTISIP
jgi:hypothetical protein